jgi:hypothetical protein
MDLFESTAPRNERHLNPGANDEPIFRDLLFRYLMQPLPITGDRLPGARAQYAAAVGIIGQSEADDIAAWVAG